MAKKRIVDENTVASNPGNVVFNPLVWMKYHTTLAFGVIFTVLLIAALMIFASIWLILPALFVFLPKAIYFLRYKKEHFQFGDSNGGIVISDNPKLVAVTTNLSKYGGSYPVVKIIEYKGKSNLGERVGTVALYFGSEDESCPHWMGFDPIPIEYATQNKKGLEEAIQSYEKSQWIEIEERLKQVPTPYKKGLYRIEEKNSNWEAEND